MAAEGHIDDGPDHSGCFGPPKRDMPPAGTTWVVPPGVAEKARMTDSGIPGCPYRFFESDELPFIDGNLAYGLQLHHPHFLELVGAPESVRLLDRAPLYWVEEMGKKTAMVAAATLQRDAGVILSNLQILSQFAMALNRMSFSMMALGLDRSCFREPKWKRYHRHHVHDGRHRICRPWGCGALRRIQLRQDLLRHRRLTCVETASTASRKIRYLRSDDIQKDSCSDIFRLYDGPDRVRDSVNLVLLRYIITQLAI